MYRLFLRYLLVAVAVQVPLKQVVVVALVV
jgi:hypothetical protein